jgi:hypothetical protein
MTEGASEPVEQAVAPAAAPAGEPERKSLWERLKPVWWLRGILAAWGLLAVADQLGFVAEDWLAVVHAFASRWAIWTSAIAGWINLRLPWSMYISPEEANLIALILLLWAPTALKAAWLLFQRGDRGDTARICVLIGALTITLIALVLPGDMETNIVTRAAVPIGIAATFYVLLTQFTSSPPIGEWRSRLLPIVLGVSVTILVVLFVPASWIAGVFILSFAVRALWALNREYTKAMFIALSFIAVLEVAYFVPVLNANMRPVVEWIDAQPSGDEQ